MSEYEYVPGEDIVDRVREWRIAQGDLKRERTGNEPMTVGELVEELCELDPTAPVLGAYYVPTGEGEEHRSAAVLGVVQPGEGPVHVLVDRSTCEPVPAHLWTAVGQ